MSTLEKDIVTKLDQSFAEIKKSKKHQKRLIQVEILIQTKIRQNKVGKIVQLQADKSTSANNRPAQAGRTVRYQVDRTVQHQVDRTVRHQGTEPSGIR